MLAAGNLALLGKQLLGLPADETVVATTTDYGGNFVSSVWRENVVATQFHPEKSQRVGLQILKNFSEMSGGRRF